MNTCEKCGNPHTMQWCKECETNQEQQGECFMCWHKHKKRVKVQPDEHYHDNCN